MTSLKTLIAAVAFALPLAAAAQAPAAPKAPTVTVYGTFNVNVQWAEATGATNPATNIQDRLALSIDSTNFGVRAAADVAYGLGVVAQCESAADISEGASNICNRNSRVGVTTPVGALFLGRWDTPYKALWYGTKADDPFGNTDTAGAANIMGSPGFRTTSGALQGFDQRATNSIVFHSAKFAGVGVRLQHQVNEGANQRDTISPRLWSGAVNWDSGPFSIGAAYERHDEFSGLNNFAGLGPTTPGAPGTATGTANSVDQAWRVSAGYELGLPMGALTIGAAVEQLMYEFDDAPAGTLKDYDRFAYQVGLKFRAGNHELRARYNLADEGDCTGVGVACNTDDLGATAIAVGYAHHLSKAAQVYAFYSQIFNDDRALYTFGVAGPQNVVGTTSLAANVGAGSDPLSVGVGMRYAF